MLKHIKAEDYYLSPWKIPENRFTQAIADACFSRHPVRLDSIPKQFINQAMCDHFSPKYRGRLAYVPVAYRTQKICERAVQKTAENIALVPLALRTIDLCVMAIRDDAKLAVEVPYTVQSAVFDQLIKKHSGNFHQGWLYNMRGNGYLAVSPPDIEKALADYHTVIEAEDREEFSESHVQDACYAIGYCHYLRQEFEQADHWLQKLDDRDERLPYTEYGFLDPKEVIDFEKKRFDSLMHEQEDMIRVQDFHNAYANVQQAEQMLLDAGNDDRVLWAYVLDKKRYVSYELALWDINEATCREAVDRLEHENLWAYDSSDDAVRHTLRSCYYRLGTLRLNEELPLEEWRVDLDLIKKAFDLVGPAEDKSVLHPFHEGRAALLLLIAAKDPAYQPECERALSTIKSLHLREKGFLHIASVLEALE